MLQPLERGMGAWRGGGGRGGGGEEEEEDREGELVRYRGNSGASQQCGRLTWELEERRGFFWCMQGLGGAGHT